MFILPDFGGSIKLDYSLQILEMLLVTKFKVLIFFLFTRFHVKIRSLESAILEYCCSCSALAEQLKKVPYNRWKDPCAVQEIQVWENRLWTSTTNYPVVEFCTSCPHRDCNGICASNQARCMNCFGQHRRPKAENGRSWNARDALTRECREDTLWTTNFAWFYWTSSSTRRRRSGIGSTAQTTRAER